MERKVHIQRAGRRPKDSVLPSGAVRVPGIIAMKIPETFVMILIAHCMCWERFIRRASQLVNMGKTKYSPFEEINTLQKEVMVFVDGWVREKKTPVPRKEIMAAFTAKKIPRITVEWAVNALLRKGYIRRAYSGSNKTFYVQLRNV